MNSTHPRLFRALITLLGMLAIGASCTAPKAATDQSTPESVPAPTAADEPAARPVPPSPADQLQREAELRRRVSADQCAGFLRELTRTPHVAGTEADRRTAEYVQNTLKSFGYNVEIKEYHCLLPYPKSIAVEMTAPQAYAAALREAPIDLDLDSRNLDVIVPFNAYSASADLTARLVYVNYARREDFQKLDSMGVSVEGAICIARYGGIYRGSKTRLAQEYGAAGLIIYSDPKDDGFVKGDVYPKGPWRPASGVQRGSSLYIFEYPGDPGTPGRPSLPGAEQLRFSDMASLPGIPVTCISSEDAEPFLRRLDGSGCPEDWQGGLPFAYHIGGTETVKVHLRIENDEHLRPIWNVIATWPGTEFPDETVVIGNHRDAWVYGAVDPSSGTAVMLEAARVIAESAKAGRPPRRTIRFASFDAEEFGMIGSTEWGEECAAELTDRCVAYINVDAAVSGPKLGVSASPVLHAFTESVLSSITDLPGQASAFDQLRGDGKNPPFGSLGSGSDYAVFVDHLGIPAIDFSSSGPYGVYHSVYDSLLWMKRFGDPEFRSHARMAGIVATTVRRLADDTLIPGDFAAVGAAVETGAAALEKKFTKLDLSEFRSLASTIGTAAKTIDERRAARLLGPPIGNATALRWNAMLRAAEKKLLLADGFMTRRWFRHVLSAPARDLGYGAAAIPPVADLLERGRPDQAELEANRVLECLRNYARHLEAIARALE